jgi:type I restriction enzyme S subunit
MLRLDEEIVDVKKGDEVGSINYLEDLERKQECFPFIRTSDLINYEIDQYPDYFVERSIYEGLNQDLAKDDILFTNDGKIGTIAMLTQSDKIVIQSHIRRIRLQKLAFSKYKLTSQYIFAMLTIPEIALYQAEKFTVFQSTIPTMANNLKNFKIPLFNTEIINKITDMIVHVFSLKEKKKDLINIIRKELDSYYDIDWIEKEKR